LAVAVALAAPLSVTVVPPQPVVGLIVPETLYVCVCGGGVVAEELWLTRPEQPPISANGIKKTVANRLWIAILTFGRTSSEALGSTCTRIITSHLQTFACATG